MRILPLERLIRISSSGCWERTGSRLMRLVLPRLYVILDSALLKHSPRESAQQLATAGVRLLQFRAKNASARELLKISSELVSCLAPHQASLIVNDRPDV